MNYKYDLSTHRALSTESVNEYEYVDNFKDLEEKAYKISGVRDSGRYQSVLQKVISVYEYLRPLPGRRIHDDYYNTGSNPPIPLQTAPPIPPSNSYDISN
ncbi:hypothetical protein L9F63_025890 [Diploptera punctata]|nr:hypothetical protein L9F63_025890 [Diploptera punctata]